MLMVLHPITPALTLMIPLTQKVDKWVLKWQLSVSLSKTNVLYFLWQSKASVCTINYFWTPIGCSTVYPLFMVLDSDMKFSCTLLIWPPKLSWCAILIKGFHTSAIPTILSACKLLLDLYLSLNVLKYGIYVSCHSCLLDLPSDRYCHFSQF